MLDFILIIKIYVYQILLRFEIYSMVHMLDYTYEQTQKFHYLFIFLWSPN